MPATVWLSLRRSLDCKTDPSDVHDPSNSRRKHLKTFLSKKVGRSGCSRSIANLKDVINASRRQTSQKPPSCSPRSIGSSEFINPLTHEVVLSNSRCELRITSYGGFQEAGSCGNHGSFQGGSAGAGGSSFLGSLKPGTPGPGGHPAMHYFSRACGGSMTTPPRKSGFVSDLEDGSRHGSSKVFNNGGQYYSKYRVSFNQDCGEGPPITCHKCGSQFTSWETAESHHLSKHAVTELVEGDPSRRIVEIICGTNHTKNEIRHCVVVDRVLKVHNMQRTLARFEEYRETVKMKASKLSKKHPRCLADGNELLRFHGTTMACSLGLNRSSSLCASEKCCVCKIIRDGFVGKEHKEHIGVFTTSTSVRAFESIKIHENIGLRKALIVCRVIAGRVHRPIENMDEAYVKPGFDSLAGKIGQYSNIEELYLMNHRALLPCFVVISKP